ncbi:helix-turn-helix domain-containing protein [Staphylococcus carnosus]|uniref:helix-turn-helix domain-containing protein n=1 Tax=Staphylococcus carnosus TaxID=1281 RepID=UPI0020A28026|nr:helix-turn-helix transcriptional regulator [Staphylococcus carnosus]UTB85177.1 hypothetical protein A2I66_05735 [Staphylococcus carnosus]
MYPNLVKAMREKNITEKKISELLGMPYTTVRDRTRGTYSFTFEQAMKINRELFPEYDSETLFKTK